MNLHGIVGPYIAAVNPMITAAVLVNTGSAIVPGGDRVPTYDDPLDVPAQVQPLSYRDIVQLDGLNIQGTRRAIYLYGRFDGIVRSQIKGGDIVNITDGVNAGSWLVALVAEQWPDWCKVLVTLQNEQPS